MPRLSSFLFQVVRFICGGGLSTLIHWLVMFFLLSLDWNATLATAVGAAIGAVTNYFLQFYITFMRRSGHRQIIPVYIGVTVLGWLFNTCLFFFLFHVFEQRPIPAQILTTLIVSCLNFFLYQKVVFHERHNQSLAS